MPFHEKLFESQFRSAVSTNIGLNLYQVWSLFKYFYIIGDQSLKTRLTEKYLEFDVFDCYAAVGQPEDCLVETGTDFGATVLDTTDSVLNQRLEEELAIDSVQQELILKAKHIELEKMQLEGGAVSTKPFKHNSKNSGVFGVTADRRKNGLELLEKYKRNYGFSFVMFSIVALTWKPPFFAEETKKEFTDSLGNTSLTDFMSAQTEHEVSREQGFVAIKLSFREDKGFMLFVVIPENLADYLSRIKLGMEKHFSFSKEKCSLWLPKFELVFETLLREKLEQIQVNLFNKDYFLHVGIEERLEEIVQVFSVVVNEVGINQPTSTKRPAKVRKNTTNEVLVDKPFVMSLFYNNNNIVTTVVARLNNL